MAGKNQVIGQARIRANGKLLETDGKSTLELGGPKRDSVVGDFQAGAFRESTEPSKVECSILVKKGTSLDELRNLTDAVVTFETDTGHLYTISDAYTAEPLSISTDEGKAKIVLMGSPAEELRYG